MSAMTTAIILCIGILVLAPEVSMAVCDTTVLNSPTISVDTNWTSAGSPYLIGGTMSITSGATLTIEAGVIVKFQANAVMNVDGGLHTSGSSGNPVILTSINDDTACGASPGSNGSPVSSDWDGISISSTGNLDVSWTETRYVQTAFALNTPSAVTMSDCIIVSSGMAMDIDSGGQSVTVTRLTANDAPIEIKGSSAPSFTDLNLLRSSLYIQGNSSPAFIGGTRRHPKPDFLRCDDSEYGRV